MKKSHRVWSVINPTFKEYIEDNPEATVMGLYMAGWFRWMIVYMMLTLILILWLK